MAVLNVVIMRKYDRWVSLNQFKAFLIFVLFTTNLAELSSICFITKVQGGVQGTRGEYAF